MKTTFLPLIVVISLAAMPARADEAKAKANFEAKCATCHGKDGKGETKMGQKLNVRDYTDAKVQEKLKDEEIFKALKEGLKKGETVLMKPIGDKFTDDDIKDLVKYVRSLKK